MNTNPEYNTISSSVRFQGAEWFEVPKKHRITVVGAGGIGSWTSLLLSKLTPRSITIYDSDKVDLSNIGGQWFKTRDVGYYKSSTLSFNIGEFSNYYCNSLCDNYPDGMFHDRITFSCVDNMQARKDIYRYLKNVNDENLLLIDGRLSAEKFQIFCIPFNNKYYMDMYEKEWLFSDSEADSDICSYKQTAFCASMIASFMVNVYINWCTNQVDNILIDRDVPFMIEYSADTMFLKTIS